MSGPAPTGGVPIIHLTTPHEVLFRQVHPLQMKGTQVTSTAFAPTEQHRWTLSVRREHLGAATAYADHIASGHDSVGTWGVSVAECAEVDLDAFDDSALPSSPPAHVSIPFGERETPSRARREHKKKASHLRDAAVRRGCCYAP